jgi:Ca2+-binding RTX toxin-like protein
MAFETIPGSASAPAQFVGSPLNDQIALQSLPGEGATNFYSEGREGDDLWSISFEPVNSTILGGQGNDVVTFNNLGFDGTDSLFQVTNSVFELNQGEDEFGNIANNIFLNITTVQGGQGNDMLFFGPGQSFYMNGNRGEDTLSGSDGDFFAVVTDRSSIFGGQGNDVIKLDYGFSDSAFTNNSVLGALGNDTILVDVDSTAAGSIFDGGDGNDFLSATATEVGTSSADLTMVGGEGNDTVIGGRGDDSIEGGSGDDIVNGGDGRDIINAGDGADVINGGSFDYAGDTMSGGTGSNRFVGQDNSSDSYTVSNFGSQDFLTNGIIFTWNQGGVDIITDWQSAAAGTNVIDTGLIGNLLGDGQTDMSFGESASFAGQKNIAIRGFYANGQFATAENGADILITQAFGSKQWDAGDFDDDNSTILLGAGGSSVLQSSNFVVV